MQARRQTSYLWQKVTLTSIVTKTCIMLLHCTFDTSFQGLVCYSFYVYSVHSISFGKLSEGTSLNSLTKL